MSYNRWGGMPQVPPAVKNIIIINVLVFLFQQVMEHRGVPVNNYLALHYVQSPLFRWWQLFTHLFMHGGFAHIFFNMFALWMFGGILENVWGAPRFILFYIICGVGAALCHLGVLSWEFSGFHNAFMAYQAHPTLNEYAHLVSSQHLAPPAFNQVLSFWSSNPTCGDCASTSIKLLNDYYLSMINEPTVGASGAVFGLLFAFGYLFPNTELMLMFPPIPIKAKWFVTIYALIELTQGIAQSAGDNIAHFAHLGGMLFAFILLRIWNNRIRNRFY